MSKGEFNTRCKFCGTQILMRRVKFGKLVRWVALNKDNTDHRAMCARDAYGTASSVSTWRAA